MARKTSAPNPFEQSYLDGANAALHHPIFRYMRLWTVWRDDAELSRDRGWARVHADGSIVVNRNARLEAHEWTWVIAHCALHVGFGHVDYSRPTDAASRTAACIAVTRFQQQLRLGSPLISIATDLPGADEGRLAELFHVAGVPQGEYGCGGQGPDHVPATRQRVLSDKELSWTDRFAIGLATAASAAVYDAGEARVRPGDIAPDNPWEQARRWFVTHFPLLGALAAGFRIVADAELTRAWQISVAAVDAELAEIYVNPLRVMTPGERRFVLAHEMLHAALRHGERVAWRDPYLWNVAADFVINGWLVEMGVGEMPEDCLYDAALKGRGAEDVYDEITKNLRRYRKLATLRGRGLGDMVSHPTPVAGEARHAGDLDDFYRRALIGGMSYHDRLGRGLLPAGLVAEIRVLEHPPPPWDVQLAQWFDRHFSPLEPSRTYARPSRRQASTPDIPRPGRIRPEIPVRERTFGVVLDTSGSMNHALMGKALGAIASYAMARDVPAARVVFCDAAAYDAGYLPVEEIAGRVRVRGRGGTVLQPGVDLLERADDFPKDGPILVITDAQCDRVRVEREHAFLVPKGATLPFATRAEVFRIS
jgi:predicted metal-dependent peptidase